MKKKYSIQFVVRRIFTRIFIHCFLILACLISIFPLLRVFSISIRPSDQVFSTSLKIIPENATFTNYTKLLFDTDFILWILNSLLLATTTSIIGVALATSAGYAFSRFKFPGYKAGLLFLLLTQMLPGVMLLLPLYIMLSKLKLVNTFLGLIIAYSVTALPFTIWLLRGYFTSIPIELEEAAMIDGCSQLAAFYRITLPLSLPALAIALFFNFLSAWNDFLIARVIIQTPEMYTWTIGITRFYGERTTLWGLFAASSVLISVPVCTVFTYLSRWLISGLTIGAIK
ncbi:MAG: ABC transporter permease subunit [Actinobacteria bacterium]|nr:ABC transporter permease subunit [Actinomycetota bacterium]